MENSISEKPSDIIRRILTRPSKPYYNEQGFRNSPGAIGAPEGYWPQPLIYDLPSEQHDWRDDIKD